MAHILIVEDEKPISELIKKNLELVGFTCEQVYDGITAMKKLEEGGYDLCILDIMLPGASGYEVIEKANNTAVIFLTAKDGVLDRIKGLNLGADDYIVKPFAALELIARVNAVLRRTRQDEEEYRLDDIVVNVKSRVVTLRGEEVELTNQEFKLLEILFTNQNIALSREKLLEYAWGYDYIGDCRTIDVHIQHLRKKLNLEDRIKTIYRLGYRLETL